VRFSDGMAQIGETFGAGAPAGPNRPVVARYTVLEKVQVRKTADTNSAKVAMLKPGETVDVVEVGNTNAKGRTRLKIKDPAGWVSDKNKEGKEMLSPIVANASWSTGSIDMSAFEPGGAGRDSFHQGPDTAEPGLASVDEAPAESSPTASPSAGSVSELGAPPAAVAQHPTSDPAQASMNSASTSAFGEGLAPTAVFGQGEPPAAFGQPAATEGIPGKAEANATLLPVLATLPAPAFEYMAAWVAEQGSEFVAAVSAARQAHQLIPAAAFGAGNASF
jgi:hypothetical protein